MKRYSQGELQQELKDGMKKLSIDADEYRRRKSIITNEISKLTSDIQNPRTIKAEVVLDETVAPIMRLFEAFFYATLGRRDENEAVRYLLTNSLMNEAEKMGFLRDRVFSMGDIGELADSIKMSLSEGDRQVAEFVPPPIEDLLPEKIDARRFWSRGYKSTKCPNCNGDAFWHPTHHDLLCIKEGKKIGIFEERPGPGAGGVGSDSPGN